jgi:hypothetical protein
MAMPASGSLGIISAPQTCGSICAAVGIANGSLTTLSLCADKTTAPYCMSEFYNYAPPTVRLVCTSCSGNFGNLATANICICNQSMYTSSCYTLCMRADISTQNQGTDSFACVVVYKAGSIIFTCTVTNGASASNQLFSTLVCQGNTMCALLCACAPNIACSLNSNAAICLVSVTPVIKTMTIGTPTYCCTTAG